MKATFCPGDLLAQIKLRVAIIEDIQDDPMATGCKEAIDNLAVLRSKVQLIQYVTTVILEETDLKKLWWPAYN